MFLFSLFCAFFVSPFFFFQVALFKSMAAAADWANGLDITSGSFQVAEVAPARRKAFENEVCGCVSMICIQLVRDLCTCI